ncbi:MAG TPA: PRC-barrel domain-containing protein [Actinomycetales bacterium]|nr:PRC-barrel domain-containing protein [Actinomycetales bacterium]
MRTSELIGCEVVDSDGVRVGRVHDIRLEARPPLGASGDPAYRVQGLVLGPVGLAQRLGYGRHDMKGPWPLTVMLRALSRRSYLVPWSDVGELGGKQLNLLRRKTDLVPVRDAQDDGRDSSEADG